MIVVQKGDTLWSLAREHLGGGQFWPQLAAANPAITQFTELKIGTKLKLPETATPTGTTRATATTR
jgi:nucleoid-associated protein YgaU